MTKDFNITILYLFYIINQSILVVIYPNFNTGMLRNTMILLILFNSLRFFKARLNVSILIFIFICLLSIVFNNIHPAFKPESKLIFVMIFFTTVGLLFKPKYPINEIINFRHIFNINTVIITLSFLAYFTEINSYGRGNFSGILKHSNTLGPIAALVCLDRVLYFFNGNKSIKSITIGCIALFVLILTGSRAALGALVLSFFIVGFYYYRLKFIVWGSGVLALLIIGFIVLKEFNQVLIPEDRLEDKYRSRTVFEKGLDNTRLNIWKDRWIEFKEKPILGSGFSAVNTEIIPEKSVSYDLIKGSIQPGSGYLGILSMLGLSGFLCFSYIIAHVITKLYNERVLYDQRIFLLVITILLFILTHSIFEGYIISPGHILFFIFWIAISYILNKHEQKN